MPERISSSDPDDREYAEKLFERRNFALEILDTDLILKQYNGQYFLGNDEGSLELPREIGRHLSLAYRHMLKYLLAAQREDTRAENREANRNQKYDCFSYVARSLDIRIPLNKLVDDDAETAFTLMNTLPAETREFTSTQAIREYILSHFPHDNILVGRIFDNDKQLQHALLVIRVGTKYYFVGKSGIEGIMHIDGEEGFRRYYFENGDGPVYGTLFDFFNPNDFIRRTGDIILKGGDLDE